MASFSRRGFVAASAGLPLLACRTSPPSAGAASLRDVTEVHPSMATRDGAGVSLRRALGSRALPILDPFLMLDEFKSDRADDYIAGFPDHPHRGFETVTYMLHGAMEHRDSLGNHGRLGPGSVQWMTAGRGIIHSEMPKQERGLMHGYQLWVNLPARLKMTKPRYQDLAPERIPELTLAGARVRVVAGEIGGARGPVADIVTAPLMLDVGLGEAGAFRHPIPRGHAAFVFVIEGELALGPSSRKVAAQEIAVLGPGDVVLAQSERGARFLLLAGQPLGEPVARRGPFVMNTDEELRRAFEDYRRGTLVGG